MGSATQANVTDDRWCVEVPVVTDLDFATSNAASVILFHQAQGDILSLGVPGTVRLPRTGRWCFNFLSEIRRDFGGSTFEGPTSGQSSYSLTFRPVP